MDCYRIVKIIDEYSIVINGGYKDGLKSGEELEVFVKGKKVIDPETKDDLGTLDFIKAKIKIDTTYPNMSICVNRINTNKKNPFLAVAQSLVSEAPDALNVDMSQASGDFSDYDTQIKIGDLVRTSLY